jgi:hypothetical protein
MAKAIAIYYGEAYHAVPSRRNRSSPRALILHRGTRQWVLMTADEREIRKHVFSLRERVTEAGGLEMHMVRFDVLDDLACPTWHMTGRSQNIWHGDDIRWLRWLEWYVQRCLFVATSVKCG